MSTAVGTGSIPALILGAGRSSRMPGRSKLLRSWGKGVVIDAPIQAARAAGLDPIVVVTPPESRDLSDRVERSGAIARPVVAAEQGRAASLAGGLAALASVAQSRAVVVLLGDEPDVSWTAIRAVVTERERSGADIARIRYRDRPGHPVVLGASACLIVRDWIGEIPTWPRLTAAGLRAIELAVDGLAPIDVDCPEALAAARARRFGAGEGTARDPRAD